MTLRRIVISVLLLAALLALPALGQAQSGGIYDLSWHTLAGGGGVSSGSAYTLSGTIGQPEAGSASGGRFALSGGFWVGGQPAYAIFLPLLQRDTLP